MIVIIYKRGRRVSRACLRWPVAAKLRQRVFVNFAPVVLPVQRRVFHRVNGVTPAAAAYLAQHRPALRTAHDAPRARNTQETLLPRFNVQLAPVANRAAPHDKAARVAFQAAQPHPVQTSVSQHHYQPCPANQRFHRQAAA